MASKAEYRAVKAKLRAACSQRRIRLEEFMKTFDIHKTKKVSVDQFARAIDASGVRLSKAEVDLLLQKYRLPDDPRSVDYRRCCDLIDKACTTKNAEKYLKPKPQHKQQQEAAPSEEVDQETLHSIKERLATAMRIKVPLPLQQQLISSFQGIVLKDVFHDFDKNNSGYVTKARFVRDLCSVVGDVALRDIDVLAAAYGRGLDINYKQLHFDLVVETFPDANNLPSTTVLNATTNSPPRPRRRTSNQGNAADVDGIEGPMRDIVARDRIRMKNFFTDYDRMRCGKCTDGQFMRAVKVCFGALTEPDLALLVAKYATDDRKVDYVAFCRSVGSVLDDDAASSTTAVLLHVDVPALPTAPCTREVRGELSDSELTAWHGLMTRLSHAVVTRRILLKPVFCDFDRGKTECVTCEQFARVLAMFNLFLTSPDEQQAILKRYASARLNSLPPAKLAFDNKAFVNFKTFCLDLDDYHRVSQRPASPAGATPFAGHVAKTEVVVSESNAQRTFPMLLRYLKHKAKRDRIRMDEYFRDCDRLRHGKITRAQFAAGLNAAGFVLSALDIRLLADEYKYEQDKDVEGKPMVAWPRLADDVDAVFTIKGLEKEPTRNIPQSIEANEQTTAVVDTTLDPRDEATVVAVLRDMAEKIQHQRLDIKPPFEDFDLANQGFVSASKFDRVLSVFHLLPPDAATARLVVLKFSERGNAPHRGVSSTCDVNYRAFLSALDAIKDETANNVPGAREFRLRQAHVSNEAMHANDPTRRSKKPSHGVALESLLKDLRLQVDTKRIRIKQFFAESDRLRSGEITLAKFHTAINRSGLVVDANDIHTLNGSFQSTTKPDQINYRGFLAAIEATEHVEDCRDSIPSMKHAEKLDALLGRIRNTVDVKRLHMKPYFEDYDRNYLMHVTKTQFASVLDMMQLGCTPAEISLLTSTYCVRHGREENPDVNYLRFIQDIDDGYTHLKHPVGVKAALKPIVK
ncbi:Aste57867_23471 [Aphanomyces stellatus]|uniref:Aste57867_23471 protein n=1 Tax=Aphanomyces stellatus TaxID=120398 RepID=A0A485LN62_9STRA|nr:hypothetical protein As57867_023400 [Aphanomyces stellatus]VFU00116.1 Aste57867_23471 [Aphanomyces stellatus]